MIDSFFRKKDKWMRIQYYSELESLEIDRELLDKKMEQIFRDFDSLGLREIVVLAGELLKDYRGYLMTVSLNNSADESSYVDYLNGEFNRYSRCINLGKEKKQQLVLEWTKYFNTSKLCYNSFPINLSKDECDEVGQMVSKELELLTSLISVKSGELQRKENKQHFTLEWDERSEISKLCYNNFPINLSKEECIEFGQVISKQLELLTNLANIKNEDLSQDNKPKVKTKI